jgi:hypothetical protein
MWPVKSWTTFVRTYIHTDFYCYWVLNICGLTWDKKPNQSLCSSWVGRSYKLWPVRQKCIHRGALLVCSLRKFYLVEQKQTLLGSPEVTLVGTFRTHLNQGLCQFAARIQHPAVGLHDVPCAWGLRWSSRSVQIPPWVRCNPSHLNTR